MIQLHTDLMEKDCLEGLYRFLKRIVEGLQRVLAVINGLQKVSLLEGS